MFTVTNYHQDNDSSKEKKTGEEVYFQGSKKNQLNQIKNYFKTILSDPEKTYYRKQIIKKVIAYTTAGVDTSRIYPEMVLASATKDLVQKKLIYTYLSIYSSANENFARMAINTFLKDCSSPNPNIRSLAIRHLSNLRFKGREQYVYPLLINGLNDFSSLVKKSCVMGLTKLIVEKNRVLDEPIRDENILNQFYEMIREKDQNLVCTAIEAINQIEVEGIAMSRKLASYLLTNISNFGQFQLPIILNYLQLYQPKTDEQIINILRTLEPKLKSSSASVALAVSKIYLKMLKLRPDLAKNINELIRSSLLSFMNHDSYEVQFVILKHIEYIIQTFKLENFSGDYKKFLLGGDQPTYIKIVKIRIMQLCIRKNNIADIINEFAEYLLEQQIGNIVVNAFSKTLLNADENQSKFIIKTIIKVIENSPKDFLCNNTLPLIRNYLRKHTNDFSMFSNIFYDLVKHATEDQSRCAVVQIIGDYGDFIEDATELIKWSEGLISDSLKISLLRANVKLFFKRPEQMASNLANIFKYILTDDDNHLQIKDYAAFLYRGLESGVDQFKQLFMDNRFETKDIEKDFQELEFNSLQIIYRQKQDKWMLDKLKYIEVPEQLEIEHVEGQPQQEKVQQRLDINVESRFKRLEVDNFQVNFNMKAQQFQQCWENYEIGSSITRIVSDVEVLSEQNLQELCKTWNINVMASAEDENEIKLYSYCKVIQENNDLGTACMELCIHKLPETLTLMIKSDNEELAGFISRYIEDFLRLNEII